MIIRTNQLGLRQTTAPFTLASVNAKTGPGWDNIVTLKGYNYNADGGGNWMGLDYVQLNSATQTNPAPQFQVPVLSAGKINLSWTGNGVLEAAPTVTGPWNPVTGATGNTYSEAIAAGNRFFRIRQP
jgi:hypothetical protein